MANYGDRISKLREKANLTQEALSSKVGISRSALSHYEKNRREPDYETLLKLSDFFGVSTDYLLKGDTIQLVVDPKNPKQLIENPYLIRFPIRLKVAMKEKGISIQDLSKHLSIDEDTLSEFFLTSPTDSIPSIQMIDQISDFLNVSSDYLLGHSDTPTPIVLAGQEINLSFEDLQLFNELKKHPVMFHDLASDPEKKVKELIKLYKMKKLFLEDEDADYGDGFGDLED